MKSVQYKIEAYDGTDFQTRKVVSFLFELYQNTNLEGSLIYNLPEYWDYLRNVVFDKDDEAIFILSKESAIFGFAHFKIELDKVFLNNLYVDPEIRKQGLGKFLFMESLKHLCDKHSFTSIELEVFASNHKIVKWYKSLGFESRNQGFWLRINKIPLVDERKIIEKRKDINGFYSLYIESNKVATIIGANLVVHDYEAVNYLGISDYDQIIYKTHSIETGVKDYSVLEIFYSMQCSIQFIKF